MRFLDVMAFARRFSYYVRNERSRRLCQHLGLGHGYICIDETTYFQCPSNPVAYSVFQDMAYSAEGHRELEEFLELSTGCRTFVDVGASGGFFSVLFAASRTKVSTVLSIEPDPGAREVLIDLREKNARTIVNWEIEPRAVMSQIQRVLFVSSGYGAEAISPLAMRNAQGCAAENNLDIRIFESTCNTLPNLLGQYAVLPDLIKIDIESFEYELIQSSLDVLRLWKPRIMLELHVARLCARGRDPQRLLASLSSIGYRRFRGGRQLSTLLAEADSSGIVRTGLMT